MTLAIRVMPNPGRAVLTANGRDYPVAGAVVDVPYGDALVVTAGQAWPLMIIGATADRPVNTPGVINWPPPMMYDTTLGKPIFLVPGSNPARWVDITGGAAV